MKHKSVSWLQSLINNQECRNIFVICYLFGDGTPWRIVSVGDGDLDKLGQIIRSTVRMIVLGLRQEAVQRLIGDPWHAAVMLSSQTRRPEVIF